jgi:hypothetical protein
VAASLTACNGTESVAVTRTPQPVAVIPAVSQHAVWMDYSGQDDAYVFTNATDGERVSVDCKTEDSCKAEYSDGAWRVYRVIP